MKENVAFRPTPFWAAAVLLALLLCAKFYSWKATPPLHVYGEIPPFELVNQKGQAFGLDDLKGRVWIADFMFTSCGSICPLMSARMKALAEKVHDPDLRFVSFSVDPDRDTPEVLAQYAERYGADPRWLFLTGDKKMIYRLAEQHFHLGVDDSSGGAETVMHSSKFVLVDARGKIRGYYDSESAAFPEPLVSDLKKA